MFIKLLLIYLSIQIVTGQENINIDPERTPYGSLSLLDIVESIEYIPLETNSSCLIGEIFQKDKIIISANYILVNNSVGDNIEEFFLFDREGKYISKIGNRGDGPGEYTLGAKPYAIDEINQRVIITNNRGYMFYIMYYDMNGKHVHSISVDRMFVNGNHVQFDGNHVIMRGNNPFRAGDPTFNYSIFSNDYQLITEKIKNVDFTTNQQGFRWHINSWGAFCHYFFNGQLHVKYSPLNDTLYSVNQSLTFNPKYIINAGRYSLTKDIVSNVDLSVREFNNRIYFQSVFETNNYVLISYQYKEKHYYQYYGKHRRQSLLANVVSPQRLHIFENGIPNDYDGGLAFWPKQQNGNEFITWYNAYLFVENENSLRPKGSQKAIENLKNVTNKIEDFMMKNRTEANPVVVIVKFKQ